MSGEKHNGHLCIVSTCCSSFSFLLPCSIGFKYKSVMDNVLTYSADFSPFFYWVIEFLCIWSAASFSKDSVDQERMRLVDGCLWWRVNVLRHAFSALTLLVR